MLSSMMWDKLIKPNIIKAGKEHMHIGFLPVYTDWLGRPLSQGPIRAIKTHHVNLFLWFLHDVL